MSLYATQFFTQPSPQLWNGSGWFEMKTRESRRTPLHETHSVTGYVGVFDMLSTGTESLTETIDLESSSDVAGAPTRAIEESVAELNQPSIDHHKFETERIARQRVTLLAASYVGGDERQEIVARLEILNQRLLHRSPCITVEQVTALEKADDQLSRIRAAREERARLLGL